MRNFMKLAAIGCLMLVLISACQAAMSEIETPRRLLTGCKFSEGMSKKEMANCQKKERELFIHFHFGGGHWFSDRRLKKDVQLIAAPSSCNFKLYSWTWNETAKELKRDGQSDGVIAQQVDPKFVDIDRGYFRVNYVGLLRSQSANCIREIRALITEEKLNAEFWGDMLERVLNGKASVRAERQLFLRGVLRRVRHFAFLPHHSDRRLKKDVKLIAKPSSCNFKLYSWTWNETAKELEIEGQSDGVIAQQVDPKFVDIDRDYFRVNYVELLRSQSVDCIREMRQLIEQKELNAEYWGDMLNEVVNGE